MPGQFTNGSQCVPCAIGEYSDAIRQMTCQECPNDETTLMLGAESVDDCVGTLFHVNSFILYSNRNRRAIIAFANTSVC